MCKCIATNGITVFSKEEHFQGQTKFFNVRVQMVVKGCRSFFTFERPPWRKTSSEASDLP